MRRTGALVGILGIVLVLYVFFNFQEIAHLKKEIKLLKKSRASLPNKSIEKKGKVLAVDTSCNLVIASLGRKDGIKEESRITILKEGKEIAQAKIIGVRYRASAAFVDEVEPTYHVSNIKTGDEILISE